MRMKAVSALLSISCCAGLFLPPLGLHTSRWDRLRITASAKEPSFDDLFAQGTAYVQSGELGLAVGCFQGASQLDPSHEPTQKLLAKLAPFMTSVEAEAPKEDEEEEEVVWALADEDEDEDGPSQTEFASRDARVDAALAELGRTGSAAAAAAAGGITPTAPSAELRPGGLVFVAGGATPLGAEALGAVGERAAELVQVGGRDSSRYSINLPI